MRFITAHLENIIGKIPKHRLLSLDVFRGLTITAMILVNNPGSWSHIYAPLKHAQWHGWTPTDLIFPFFVFIVGVSIQLSINVQKNKGFSDLDIIKSSAIRMIKLILLGWVLALFYYKFGSPAYSWLDDRLFSMRFMGVLQRIGLVYFITVLLFLAFNTRLQVALMAIILLVYGLLMAYMPYSDAAGNVYQGLYLHGNSLSAWLDSTLLASKHLYYGSATPFSFDPEGVLSTLPAIATCLSGVLVGTYLQKSKQLETSRNKQVAVLALIGIALIVAGELFGLYLPINKALWTPSYVVLSSGYAMLTLAICMYFIDVKGYRNWTAPFVVFGANSIAFFMFSGFLARILIMIPVADTTLKGWLYSQAFMPTFGAVNGSLAFALSFLVISYGVMHAMYRNNIIWKV